MKTMRKDNYKKIIITASELDETYFNVEGVTNLGRDDGEIHFFYKGDINVMTRLISEQSISDVTIEEPTLEEVFMHYYE